jgi:L-fuconate dehydratase
MTSHLPTVDRVPISSKSRVVALEVHDVRFPTSATLDGSDAMNPSPDYAAAYVVLRTDDADGLAGHGFTFTIGAGNEVQLAAIKVLSSHLVGVDVDELCSDLGSLWQRLVWDSPLRWLGPEKGIMHMAIVAVVNAVWDLAAKRAKVPLWLYLSSLSPAELLELVDLHYLEDVLSPAEALELLEAKSSSKQERVATLLKTGYPAYTTTPGWLGYSDERLSLLCDEAARDGFDQVKLKVGNNLADDLRRCRVAREVLGPDIALAVDANQVWDVPTAVDWTRSLEQFGLAWVEEPTHPDDIWGLATIRRAVHPVPVATGEHVANRVIFKQLLQAEAIDVMQIDACRVAGVNENIVNLLLAAKFGVPVCPHAGGVGLCEAVQHLAMFDFVAVSGSMTGRRIEWIDHLHANFVHPANVMGGHYIPPEAPGYSMEMKEETVQAYSFPDGEVWQAIQKAEG